MAKSVKSCDSHIRRKSNNNKGNSCTKQQSNRATELEGYLRKLMAATTTTKFTDDALTLLSA